jgi:hypothetical protein
VLAVGLSVNVYVGVVVVVGEIVSVMVGDADGVCVFVRVLDVVWVGVDVTLNDGVEVVVGETETVGVNV